MCTNKKCKNDALTGVNIAPTLAKIIKKTTTTYTAPRRVIDL
jgi:hypothetical protein